MTKKKLISKIDDALGKYQFHGDGPLWNRGYLGFVDVIDLQISKSNDTFTVNVGVADRFVIDTCWGLNDENMIDEPSCTVRTRLGELLYGRDVWWNLSDAEDIEKAVIGIRDAAIPFIQLNHNIDHMIESLENHPAAKRYPPGVIYLALLYYRRGESDRCKEMFNSMKLNGAWDKKAADIMAKLN